MEFEVILTGTSWIESSNFFVSPHEMIKVFPLKIDETIEVIRFFAWNSRYAKG
jgi:predicted glycosyltransferase